MGKSKTKQKRLKAERAGLFNPELNRGQWHRKPLTQVVQNKIAEQRRTQCRTRGSRDGADFFDVSSYSVHHPCYRKRKIASGEYLHIVRSHSQLA